MQVGELRRCVIYAGVLGAVVCVSFEGEDKRGKNVSADGFFFLDELCCHLLAWETEDRGWVYKK